jgi:hypothetical protein
MRQPQNQFFMRSSVNRGHIAAMMRPASIGTLWCVLFVLQYPSNSYGFQSPVKSISRPTSGTVLSRNRPLVEKLMKSSVCLLQMSETPTEEKQKQQGGGGGMFSDDVQREAKEALESVGWASPTKLDDGEMTSDDPFVQEINAGIKRDFGVGLDDLLNPAKVVNLERELYNLRSELATLTDKKNNQDGTGFVMSSTLTTEECDGGGGGDDAEAVRAKIVKKETDLALERRSVFRDWLKNVFVGQAVISLGVSFIMATNPKVLFGGFDWYYSYNM